MKTRFNFQMAILTITALMVFTQCKKTDTPVDDPLVIKLGSSATLGNYLTDKDGNTLYFFSADANGANNCTGGCTTLWPNFNAPGLTQAQLTTGLVLSDFKTISTANGDQLTYQGWPLYYYSPNGVREAPGLTSGEGVGGVWFVAKPDYTVMLVKAQLLGADGKNYVVTGSNVYSEGAGTTLYFTDGKGRTLYSFVKDSANINKFTKADLSNNSIWPIYETNSIVVPSVLDKSLFGVITVYGKSQLTYKGWPMYYFGSDLDSSGNFRGHNKGVSVPTPGIWPVFYKDFPTAPSK